MSLLTIPNNFVANTLIQSALVDANFTAVATVINGNIDHSNTINSTGFYASDIKPLTAAEATFGLTATGVGYNFLANDATATPLTVSGVSGQSADLLDVTLTSGGTKALAVSSTGAASFQSSAANLGVTFAYGNFAASNTPSYSVPAGGSGAGNINGFLISNISGGTSGGVLMGGASKLCQMTYNNNHGNAIEFQDTASATYTAIFAGAYTNSASSEKIKKNIAPLKGSLGLIKGLNPVAYDLIKTGLPEDGFTIENVAAVIPRACTMGANGPIGYMPFAVLAHAVQAIKELEADYAAYKVAHP